MRREFGQFAFRTRGWFIAALFMAISGAYFSVAIETRGSIYMMKSIFNHLELLSIVIVPLLSMGAIAGERQNNTLVKLLSAPIREETIILSKFLGEWLFYGLLLVLTLVFPWIISQKASPNYWPIVTGYVGLLLSGALFLSLGIFISTCAPNAIFSGIMTLLVLTSLRIVPFFQLTAKPSTGNKLLSYLHFQEHLRTFYNGVFSSGSICYFLVVTALLLLLSTLVLKGKRLFAI